MQRERAESAAAALAIERGHAPRRLLVKPTLANLLLWRSTYIADGRIYLFTLFLDAGEPYSTAGSRALFEAMIATVQLTPESAVAPSPTPS